MPTSIIDKIRELDEEKAKLIEGAKKEAIAKAEAAIAELNSLGFNYQLREVDASRAQASGKTRQGAKQIDPNRPCSICNFITDPPHDGRSHRGQKESKRPFTDEELQALNMKRIS